MALIVETGSGLAAANSYVSLSDANSYVADHGNSSAWSAATDSRKEECLRLATQFIDLKYGSRFKGQKGTKAQALNWPRLSADDENGFSYEPTDIPACVKHACIEAALRVLAGDDLLGVIEEPGTIRRERSKAGPLEMETEYVGGKSQQPAYPKIAALLRPVTGSNTQMSRG